MKRIANAQELTAALQGLLEDASAPNPSRHELAAKLGELAEKTAGSNDYISNALRKAGGSIATAEGGLHYRLFDREGQNDASGQPILNEAEQRSVLQAWKHLREAQESINACLKLISKVDLGFTA